MNQSEQHIELPEMPLPPGLPADDALAAYDAERTARAEEVLAFARGQLGLHLTTWQEQLIRALYLGNHVRAGRSFGLRTVERVITEYEAGR